MIGCLFFVESRSCNTKQVRWMVCGGGGGGAPQDLDLAYFCVRKLIHDC